MTSTIPLFPLKTVLFPGGVLPLRIFEPRYLDMVSDCLKKETGIGVVQLKSGMETGPAAEFHDTGTVTSISYWHKRNDGLLGITLKGEQRFQVVSQQVQANQLIIAEVEILDDIPQQQEYPDHDRLVMLLQQIVEQMGPPFSTIQSYYDDIEWVSARLVEFLPIDLKLKQLLLESNDIAIRLDSIEQFLSQVK